MKFSLLLTLLLACTITTSITGLKMFGKDKELEQLRATQTELLELKVRSNGQLDVLEKLFHDEYLLEKKVADAEKSNQQLIKKQAAIEDLRTRLVRQRIAIAKSKIQSDKYESLLNIKSFQLEQQEKLLKLRRSLKTSEIKRMMVEVNRIAGERENAVGTYFDTHRKMVQATVEKNDAIEKMIKYYRLTTTVEENTIKYQKFAREYWSEVKKIQALTLRYNALQDLTIAVSQQRSSLEKDATTLSRQFDSPKLGLRARLYKIVSKAKPVAKGAAALRRA